MEEQALLLDVALSRAPAGWHSLVRRAYERIEAHNRRRDGKVQMLNVRDRDGKLELWTDQRLERRSLQMDLLVICDESVHVCQECGQSGKPVEESAWRKTLCAEHARQLRERVR